MTHSPVQRRFQISLVWFWFSLTTGIGLLGFLLFMRTVGTPVPASWGASGGVRTGATDWFNSFQLSLLSPMTMSAIGALILTRRPAQRIGRLLMALGLFFALSLLIQEWAVYGHYTLKADLPGVEIAAWIANWIWVIPFSLLLLTAALFPDGRFVSRHWGWLISAPLLLFVLPILPAAMIETPMTSAFQIPNPFVATPLSNLYDLLFYGVVFLPISAVVVLVSVMARFRVSQQRTRHQMKWMLAGMTLSATLTIVGLALYGLGNPIGATLVNGAPLGLSLGVGVALLRHQLYDIDVIIRRTLQYSVLSGLLALTYFGLVIVLQNLLSAVGSQQSEFVTVASTLAIAALFFPLRNRVQAFIDRRFYRQKYDAQKVLAEFAATCRDETDLDKLTARLVEVVEETMQPESVGVWLKPSGKDRTANRRRD